MERIWLQLDDYATFPLAQNVVFEVREWFNLDAFRLRDFGMTAAGVSDRSWQRKVLITHQASTTTKKDGLPVRISHQD
jgi:hypothetical protein